ncbi:MAG: hypothetical protein D6749_03545 [Chloroflexota bacterium]|nr:MAG: hypothetical protein D6749_03545 [Chloroflexota bacterium]
MLRLILIALLLLIAVAPSQLSATAQGALCTAQIAAVYECPDCAKVLFRYPKDTLLYNVTPVNEAWLGLTDTATGMTGFIRAAETQPCVAASWQLRPVVPSVSERARQIYARGIALGNNPKAFSVIGDCQSVPAFFLGVFDRGDYALGKYSDLQATIDHFKGSFNRRNMTVHSGFNVASVLTETWADPQRCEIGETPLMCEYRLHKPSIAFVIMETIWSGDVAAYESHLRQIVSYLVEQGVVPILGTKADNIEGGHRVNAVIAQVADEFGVPLWNFWLAVQPLPNHGLQEDGFHLTFSRSIFSDPLRLRGAWAIRNLTALQALDAVWRGLR